MSKKSASPLGEQSIAFTNSDKNIDKIKRNKIIDEMH